MELERRKLRLGPLGGLDLVIVPLYGKVSRDHIVFTYINKINTYSFSTFYYSSLLLPLMNCT